MKFTLFPTLEEALYLHQVLLEKYGGTFGIRDQGLLESALMRPQMKYYTSLSEQAATLLQSLARNHAFVDGNKRMAFALAVIFLKMNGYFLKVKSAKAYDFLVKKIISGHAEIPEITTWIEKHMHMS